MTFRTEILADVKFLKGMTRGDESSLLVRLKDKYKNLKEVHTDNSIVANEFPETIYQWSKVLFTEGRMRFIIDSEIGGSTKFNTLLKVILRILFIISIPSIIISSDFYIILLSAVFVLIRLINLFRYYRTAFSNAFKSKIGFIGGVFSPLLCTSLIYIRDFGYVKEFMSSFFKRVKLQESSSSVLEKI